MARQLHDVRHPTTQSMLHMYHTSASTVDSGLLCDSAGSRKAAATGTAVLKRKAPPSRTPGPERPMCKRQEAGAETAGKCHHAEAADLSRMFQPGDHATVID